METGSIKVSDREETRRGSNMRPVDSAKNINMLQKAAGLDKE